MEITHDQSEWNRKLVDHDTDGDGFLDASELLFGTDPTNPDTDGDGFLDGAEVMAGYSPLSIDRDPREKSIRIRLSTQELEVRLGDRPVEINQVSTGKKGMRTPTGTFSILSKTERKWSRSAKLWMPWWMQFTALGNGIHELPEWPGGRKEGANHLGRPVSHGCVRLGVGPAERLYDWVEVGTKVVIVK